MACPFADGEVQPGPAAATVADWSTEFYTSVCASVFDTYMRDLDISPDGKYLVVTTTGAYRAPPSACDTWARFEVASSGDGVTLPGSTTPEGTPPTRSRSLALRCMSVATSDGPITRMPATGSDLGLCRGERSRHWILVVACRTHGIPLGMRAWACSTCLHQQGAVDRP